MLVAEEEAKKEKMAVEEARRAENEANKVGEETKVALLAAEEAK